MKPKPEAMTDATVMTRAEVATFLKVKPREVARLGVPCLPLGPKTPRYLRSDVLAWLEGKRPSSSKLELRRA